jgi:hypothetical protein
MVILSNAFSLSMLSSPEVRLRVKEAGLQDVKKMIHDGFVSAIGHQATAEILSTLLEVPIEFNRIQIKLNKGDSLIVFQILQRLEEGKILSIEEIMALPHKFFIVEVED